MPEGRTIEGYAAVTESRTDLGWFREEIAWDAFNDADMSDVRALFNHDPNQILARTKSGTLKVEIDDKGLKYSFEAPNTSLGNDLLELVRRGDISQSSFAFTVKEQEWIERQGERELRRITKVDTVFDVSPVTYPAYGDTTVAARSKEAAGNEHPQTQKQPEWSDDVQEANKFITSRFAAKNK